MSPRGGTVVPNDHIPRVFTCPSALDAATPDAPSS